MTSIRNKEDPYTAAKNKIYENNPILAVLNDILNHVGIKVDFFADEKKAIDELVPKILDTLYHSANFAPILIDDERGNKHQCSIKLSQDQIEVLDVTDPSRPVSICKYEDPGLRQIKGQAKSALQTVVPYARQYLFNGLNTHFHDPDHIAISLIKASPQKWLLDAARDVIGDAKNYYAWQRDMAQTYIRQNSTESVDTTLLKEYLSDDFQLEPVDNVFLSD